MCDTVNIICFSFLQCHFNQVPLTHLEVFFYFPIPKLQSQSCIKILLNVKDYLKPLCGLSHWQLHWIISCKVHVNGILSYLHLASLLRHNTLLNRLATVSVSWGLEVPMCAES